MTIARCRAEQAEAAAYLAVHPGDFGASLGREDWLKEELEIMSGLPKPYYSEPGIQIFLGDCRDILPLLPKVDLVLTDPPYGHGDKWSGGTWGAASMYAVDAKRWDAEPVSPDLLSAAILCGHHSIVWGGNYFGLSPSRCWLAWEKSSKMETLADFELAWTNMDRPAKMYREDRNPDGKRYHPTQKPLNLFVWCLKFLPDAALILDPFMGSGTTLVAAKQLGRRAIGIEIEERYCAIAVDRLRQAVLPLEPAAPPAEQLEFPT